MVEDSGPRPHSWQEQVENFKYFWERKEYDSIFWHFVIPLLIAPILLLFIGPILLTQSCISYVKRINSSIKQEQGTVEQQRSTEVVTVS